MAKESSISQRLTAYSRYTEIQHFAYNIAVLQQQKNFHSLAILSFFPAEGKTLFSATLAMAYEQSTHSKVLIVDTTTMQNPQTLALKDCFGGSESAVQVTSLKELRKGSDASPVTLLSDSQPNPPESEIVEGRSVQVPRPVGNDVSLLKSVTEDRPHHYGLVLLDTAPLHARNRNNTDPLLVARLADASILVVSRAFLDSPKIMESLKVLDDPQLHLLGIVANEEQGS